MHGLTNSLFKESHGYSWDGLATIPSNMTTTFDLKAISSYVNIENITESTGFLQEFLGYVHVPW
jgi:hypothetical protein